MNTKLSYSIREAVAASSLSRTTIYGLIKSGDLPTIKIGARTLIGHADLRALLDSRRVA